MAIWKRITSSLLGGFTSFGPGGVLGGGDGGGDSEHFDTQAALKLTAVRACVGIRAETIGTMPLHLRDGAKKILTDHPLYHVLHRSPNANMTAAEFWSLATAMQDLKGNSVNIIERGHAKKVVSLIPVDPDNATFEYNKSGSRKKWKIGKDEHSDDDILHLRGFALDGEWGAPTLDLGRQVIGAQITANRSAQLAFKQGLKVGGFFLNEGQRDMNTEQLREFQQRLDTFGRPENIGKWMVMLRGLKPLAGTEFSVKPSEAQLLESRYFGIEEICRLFNVPPPLIGHTSKASSWASSLENLNLHFLIYSLNPSLVRNEQRIEKKLLTPAEIASGVQAKFSLQGLLRGDTKTRQAFYASGLQNGYLCQDEVRDFEDMPALPNGEGQVYRVQLNMAGADTPKKTEGDEA